MRKWLILGVMLIGMASVWPLGLVRRPAEERSGDVGHLESEAIGPGECLSQTFLATESYLESLGFVLRYEEGLPREGSILFELLDAEGNPLFRQQVGYGWIPNYSYFDIYVKKRLRAGALYEFRVGNVDVTENLPRAVYTDDDRMNASPSVEMAVNGERVQGAALGRYTWMEPMDWQNVLELWAFLGMAGFFLTEVSENIGARRTDAGKQGERKEVKRI